MARRSDPSVWRWWRDLLESFDPDRWTVAEFCRRHEVSTASFYAWRRRLGGRADRETGSRGSGDAPPRASAFLPIRMISDPAGSDGLVQVHLPGGVRVEVPADERELLLELIARVTASEETSP